MQRFGLVFLLLLMQGTAHAAGHFSLGIEGFKDHYHEPSPTLQVSESADYGSLTGLYVYDAEEYFLAFDGRVSYGRDDYRSLSGSIDNIPQYEEEARIRLGTDTTVFGNVLKPYIGFGQRWYWDNSKGTVTTLNAFGYDRRIMQLYAPIGASYYFSLWDWSVVPNVEYDRLIWGSVKSRLAEGGPGYYNIDNTQRSGSGWRGEVMFSPHARPEFEFGPFLRYWNMQRSDTVTAPNSTHWVEPDNNRTQVGATLRYKFD